MSAQVHPSGRLILHVDMDCFFAAVEERENPKLKGRPVIVGSDPKGGLGRGIVATCNYAARRQGVRSALPISLAFQRCPKGVYLRPRFPLYSQASKKVMAVLSQSCDVLEPAGIDEAYLDVSSLKTFEAARDRARLIQNRVAVEEGLSCSIGVASNKLIAKLASDHKKPGGLTVVIDSRINEFLDPKPVGALRGVGPKTRELLNGMGLETIKDLRAFDRAKLDRDFGRFGETLWRQARGLDERPIEPARQAKSISRETTFEADTDDVAAVRETLLDCVREVRQDMLADESWARTLTVKARYEGYETHSRQTTLKLATASRLVLESAALSIAEPFLNAGRKFRLIGFGVSKLSPPEELLPLDD